MIRVPFEEMKAVFERVLKSRNVNEQDAVLCAKLIAETSLEGVYTHGAHRFVQLMKMIDTKIIDVGQKPTLVSSHGVLERWDGNHGMGNLNAHQAMSRAIELAKERTIGVVTLRNTNHWMRPGTYGLMAAEAGCIGILWTNTMPLMPAWGGLEPKVGNNPMVIAVPSSEDPLLVDMAMSLFSYGKLETHAREHQSLPVVGGWNSEGNLTTDAQAILDSKRPLPIGFWKGTSLALALDLVVAALSGGRTTLDILQDGQEYAPSQVFIAIDLSSFEDRNQILARIDASLADIAASTPLEEDKPVRWPGQLRKQIREENLSSGIPTNSEVWQQILAL